MLLRLCKKNLDVALLLFENDELIEEIRQLIYGKSRNKYRILFTVREDTVFVLHIRHSSQAPLTSEEIDEEEF